MKLSSVQVSPDRKYSAGTGDLALADPGRNTFTRMVVPVDVDSWLYFTTAPPKHFTRDTTESAIPTQ